MQERAISTARSNCAARKASTAAGQAPEPACGGVCAWNSASARAPEPASSKKTESLVSDIGHIIPERNEVDSSHTHPTTKTRRLEETIVMIVGWSFLTCRKCPVSVRL